MAPAFLERAGLALSVGTSNSGTQKGSFEFAIVGHPETCPLRYSGFCASELAEAHWNSSPCFSAIVAETGSAAGFG